MRIEGIREVCFTREGQTVKGTTLYTSEESKGVYGRMTDRIFIPESRNELMTGVTVGDEVQMFYNKYGKVIDIVRRN